MKDLLEVKPAEAPIVMADACRQAIQKFMASGDLNGTVTPSAGSGIDPQRLYHSMRMVAYHDKLPVKVSFKRGSLTLTRKSGE